MSAAKYHSSTNRDFGIVPRGRQEWSYFVLSLLGYLLLAYSCLLALGHSGVQVFGVSHPLVVFFALYGAVAVATAVCWRITGLFPLRCIYFLLPATLLFPHTVRLLGLQS